KTPRLSKSGVEYLDYSWGVWSGCRNLQAGICSVKACWAKGIALHYPKLYPYGFEPHYYHEAIESPMQLKKPSRISVGWVGDIIGYCDSSSVARESIIRTIQKCPQHTFLFLTKNPEKLHQWSPFPDNCWVGVSVTNQLMLSDALLRLIGVDAKVKFLSFEPLLGEINVSFNGVGEIGFPNGELQWVIIGSQTKPTVFPKIEWVSEIVQACDKAKIPVFLKGNLEPLWTLENSREPFFKFHRPSPGATEIGKLRQEMPDVKAIH
ncbi:hypothetical protein LCGC14_3016750, partial [marine sediment metagenome]